GEPAVEPVIEYDPIDYGPVAEEVARVDGDEPVADDGDESVADDGDEPVTDDDDPPVQGADDRSSTAVDGDAADRISSALRPPGRKAVTGARAAALRIADIATGSGAIAVTLASELPRAMVVATDISVEAAAIAVRNAERNGVAERVTVRVGDLFAAVEPGARFDLIVSNPPYVRSAEIAGLAPHVRREPHQALDGGDDGLVILRRLVADAARHLVPGGWLVVEHGHDQAEAVAALIGAAAAFEPAAMRCDLGGRPRVSYARKCL
ncbi:MAG: HemK/PrmC family methyltransferase, partial [Myxococcota bacterium]